MRSLCYEFQFTKTAESASADSGLGAYVSRKHTSSKSGDIDF